MTKSERKLLEMAYTGILEIGRDGLIWKCQKKHKEWKGYKKCRPRLIGHETHGYIRIGIRDENSNNLKAYVHRLVFMYFYGDIPKGLQINHKDGNGHNNCLGNLELMTQSQNMIHAITVLGRQIGNRTHKARHWKIPREDIGLIQESKLPARELAEQYGVTPERIYQIRGGN